MAAMLLENIKLILLFVLIGSVIGLAHVDGGKAKTARPTRLRGYFRPAAAHR